MKTAPIPPTPFPCPDPQPPVHRRATEGFETLLRVEQDVSVVNRIVSQFLGAEVPGGRNLLLGLLRVALLWSRLPGFLADRGWQVAGSVGFESPKLEGLAAVRFESLRLGPELWLEIPQNLVLFVERGTERASICFEASRGYLPEDQILVGVHSADVSSSLLEEWLEDTQKLNPLRGRKLLARGALVEARVDPEDGRLFLDPSIRETLDFAVRRFLSPASARLGLRRRAGLILTGQPGTGKTSLGREIAESVPCTFLWVTPTDLPTGEAVRELYELARWLQPSIVLIEDLDLVAESREVPRRSPALGQLMDELDGAAGDHAVFTIATSNRLEVVERAVRSRPGRFDQILTLVPPSFGLCSELLAHRTRRCETRPQDLEWAAGLLGGATGAEIEEVANAAVAAAVLDGQEDAARPLVTRAHFEVALLRTQRAPDRRTAGFGTASGEGAA